MPNPPHPHPELAAEHAQTGTLSCQFPGVGHQPRWHTGGVLLIYDGECGFCVRSARWIAARLPPDARVEPWQSLELAEVGLSQPDVEAAVWWIDRDGGSPRRARGAEAIGWSLIAAGGFWRIIGRLIVRPPLRWLARPGYALVAANRHRLPGVPGSTP